MNIGRLINPQGWFGQLVLLGAIIAGSFAYGLYVATKNCPPTTAINVEQQIKGKKGAVISNDVTGLGQDDDCLEWLKTLSNKEVKNIRKSN